MSSYRHLQEVGIHEGEPVSFTLHRVVTEGLVVTNDVEAPVERFAGGGFYGSVLLLPDSVIKTTQPGPTHELLRHINWPVPFPSRSSETAAQLDYLSGRILREVVPAVTAGKIIVPQALGYTKLADQLGYSQVIERINGRGPTFLDGGKENHIVREARQTLWDMGVEFGFEHAAQIHPNNPFGKPNIWLNDAGKTVWLDYLPAFRHTGYVRPFFYFGFHKDVRKAFGSDQPTYGTINTTSMRDGLQAHEQKFTDEQQAALATDLDVYDELMDRHQAEQGVKKRKLFIADAEQRQVITAAEAEELHVNDVGYINHRVLQAGRLAVRAGAEFADGTPLCLLWNQEARQKAAKFFSDPEYRRSKIIEGTVLRGYKQAREHTLVSETDYEQALSILPAEDMRIYTAMQLGYFINSRLLDLLTVPLAVGAVASSHPAEASAAVAAFNVLGPGVVRAAGTAIAGHLLKRDFKRMTLTTAIPMAGTYLAIPSQIKRDYGESAREIMHYNLRSLAAAISNVRPHGGWGSDLEEKIWDSTQNFAQGTLDIPKIRELQLVNAKRAKDYPVRAGFAASLTQ